CPVICTIPPPPQRPGGAVSPSWPAGASRLGTGGTEGAFHPRSTATSPLRPGSPTTVSPPLFPPLLCARPYLDRERCWTRVSDSFASTRCSGISPRKRDGGL